MLAEDLKEGLASQIYLALYEEKKSVSELSDFIYENKNHRSNITRIVKNMERENFVRIVEDNVARGDGSKRYIATPLPILQDITRTTIKPSKKDLEKMLRFIKEYFEIEINFDQTDISKIKTLWDDFWKSTLYQEIKRMEQKLEEGDPERKKIIEKYGWYDSEIRRKVYITVDEKKMIEKLLNNNFFRFLVWRSLYKKRTQFKKSLKYRRTIKRFFRYRDIPIDAIDFIVSVLIDLSRRKIQIEIHKMYGEEKSLNRFFTSGETNKVNIPPKEISELFEKGEKELLDKINIDFCLKLLRIKGEPELPSVYELLTIKIKKEMK
jgi:DNA-binding MarR family transcriptional regulator